MSRRSQPVPDALVHGYLDAKQRVIAAGYEDDIGWAEALRDFQPTRRAVLCEAAWVIVNSGFRFTVAQKLWPGLRHAFHDFDPDRVDASCREPALRHLRHERKIDAIIAIAAEVRRDHLAIVANAHADPRRLCLLPYIGQITCWHLAKVLGADVIKPDVHLARAAESAGYPDAFALCSAIQSATGERLTVIDSVLWRYGEQMRGQGWPGWARLFGAEGEAA